MNVAIPTWLGRVSPVFDVAGRVLVLDLSDGQEQSRHEVCLDEPEPALRAEQVAALGVDLLICGGISQVLEAALSGRGIATISRICGTVDEVVQAFLAGRLEDERFLMPGCCGGRPPGRGGCRRGRQRWRGSRCE